VTTDEKRKASAGAISGIALDARGRHKDSVADPDP